MPVQQRRRLHEQPTPERPGEQPSEPSQHRPVCPGDRRPGHPPAQHRDLVAQHQQLSVLGCRASGQQRKPPQHLAEQQIDQSQSHAPIIAAE